jgi:hypothetical protein
MADINTRHLKFEKEALIAGGFIAAFSVIITLLRANFFSIPLDCDEGVYSYIAWRFGFGEMPYRDIIDHKPPVIYLVYLLAFKILGYSVTALRGFTALWVILTMVALYAVGNRMFGRKAGVVAAALYTLYQANVTFQGAFSNVEVFLPLPLLLALFFIYPKNNRVGGAGYFLSGFFFSTAFFMKETVAVAGLLYLLLYRRGEKNANKFGALALGALAPAVALAWWLWQNGSHGEFWKYGVIFNYFYLFNHYTVNSVSNKLSVLFTFIIEMSLPLSGLVCAAFFAAGRTAGRGYTIAALSSAALLLPVLIMRGSYPHYYLTALPFLCLCFGACAAHLWGRTKLKARVVLVFFPAVVFIATFGGRYAGYFGPGGTQKAVSSQFVESAAVSDVINLMKSREYTVFAWPIFPEIYFQTKSRSPSRLIYDYADYARFEKELHVQGILEGLNSMPDIIVLSNSLAKLAPFEQALSRYTLYIEMPISSIYLKKSLKK